MDGVKGACMRGYAGKIAAYFLSVTLLVYAFATAWSVHSRVVEARAVLQERERTAAALRRENAALEKQLQLPDERESLERIARVRLGLVYPDEKVIVFLGD